MKPNAFAPAATLACASRRLVVAQILTQVIGLRPPEPITLAKPRQDAVRASATRPPETRRIPLASGGQYHRRSRSRFPPPSLLCEVSSRPAAARYSDPRGMCAGRGYSRRWCRSQRRARAATPRGRALRREHRVATRPPGGTSWPTPSGSARQRSATRHRLGGPELPAIGTHPRWSPCAGTADAWLRTQSPGSSASPERTSHRSVLTARPRQPPPVRSQALRQESRPESTPSTATPSSVRRSPQYRPRPHAAELRGTLWVGAVPRLQSAPAGLPTPSR